ncbi:MAG: DUF1501 domain-containing protein [Nannocystaceae bacterium]
MPLDRRRFLQSAAAGLAGLAWPREALAAGDPRHFIVVFAQGGWDVTFALDPKSKPACDVPEGKRARYPGGLEIFTGPGRPSVARFFEANARRAAVVNGLWVGSVAHAPSRARVLTGTRSLRAPDVGAIFAAAAAEREPTLAMPYVDLGGGARSGPLARHMGRVGATNQLVALLDRAKAQRKGKGKGKGKGGDLGFDPDAAERQAIEAFVERRAALLAREPGSATVDEYRGSLARAEALRQSPDLRGLEIGRTTSLAQQSALAIALFQAGIARAAYLDTRLDWDTHDDIADQDASHEQLFAGLVALMAALDAAGLAERTTVAVLSEFSRTPKLNSQPQPGKDHWPVTSALIVGGGVRAGRYGATDDALGALRIRLDDGRADDRGHLLQYDNFAAGLLEHLGVSSRRWITTAEPFHGPFA